MHVERIRGHRDHGQCAEIEPYGGSHAGLGVGDTPTGAFAIAAATNPVTDWSAPLNFQGVTCFGPVRVSIILAVIATPFRFRGKRQLWPYVGLGVITRTSSEKEFVDGRLQKKKRAPLTRGLNRNHNPQLKNVFKGAATAAAAQPGPLKDVYDRCVAGGVPKEMAKLTLARKLAAVALRLWKKGENWDPEKLTMQPT